MNADCDICYREGAACENLYILTCCKNNNICMDCRELLIIDNCPFCRTALSNSYSNRTRSNSVTIDYNSTMIVSFLDEHIDDYSFDDITYYSKIYRRKRLRMLKIRERNLNKNDNKSKRSLKCKNRYNNRSAKKNDISNIIRQDLIL